MEQDRLTFPLDVSWFRYVQKIVVHGSEMKYDTYRSCPEKYTSTILYFPHGPHT